jgi:hypothetical protein
MNETDDITGTKWRPKNCRIMRKGWKINGSQKSFSYTIQGAKQIQEHHRRKKMIKL